MWEGDYGSERGMRWNRGVDEVSEGGSEVEREEYN